ncbi:MAG: hypothetical protein JST59_01255 [Actinobacteria bacterium]|nr:hypothetical protein [Actinomycetota bacterium]
MRTQELPLSNSNKMQHSKEKDDRTREEKFRLQTENTQLKIFNEEQSKRMNEIVSECSTIKQESRMHQYNLERKCEQVKALEE